MGIAGILTLAVGLAMDATAVSVSRGCCARTIRARHVFWIAALFGGFQTLMPLIGSLIGSSVGSAVQRWDHWIAFVVLGAIGGKMIWDAHREDEEELDPSRDLFDLKILLLLAVATSIDALVVGFTLPILAVPQLLSVTLIGVTTACLSALGLLIGKRVGPLLGSRLDLVGGLVLICLGIKILVEHTLRV